METCYLEEINWKHCLYLLLQDFLNMLHFIFFSKNKNSRNENKKNNLQHLLNSNEISHYCQEFQRHLLVVSIIFRFTYPEYLGDTTVFEIIQRGCSPVMACSRWTGSSRQGWKPLTQKQIRRFCELLKLVI